MGTTQDGEGMTVAADANLKRRIDNALTQCGQLSLPTLCQAVVVGTLDEVREAADELVECGQLTRYYASDGRPIYGR